VVRARACIRLAVDQLEQRFRDLGGGRRATGDPEIDREDVLDRPEDLVGVTEDVAAQGTVAERCDAPWLGHRSVGGEERLMHARGHRARDKQEVCVPRRGENSHQRRQEPHERPHGDVDLKVVALDTLGLLLFFIPGVIAFAVDFTTGAIYLPPEQKFGGKASPAQDQQLVTVQVPQKELTNERIEQVASRHTGHDVHLVAGEYQTAPLTKLEDFWTTRKQLVEKYL